MHKKSIEKGDFYYQLSRIFYYRIKKIIILFKPRLNNLIIMIIWIISSQSVMLSEIYQQLKDCYSLGNEQSKMKRLQRVLSNENINSEKL